MLRSMLVFVLLSVLSLGLEAKDGLNQKHLVSVSPQPLATGVSDDATIEIVFDAPIVAASVKRDTITLKKVKGVTTLADKHTLRFTSHKPLKYGKHTVRVKRVKLHTAQSDNTELKPKNAYERLAYWWCSRFYDNPADCPLCKRVCTNHHHATKTKKITYTFRVDDASPRIETITLNKTAIELQEGNETTLTVTATYDDNTTQEISGEVTWDIADTSIASIDNTTLKGLKEGSTTLQARYKEKTSKTLHIVVYKEINGHRLPPEPDPAINNATLLGVDSNDNGVRDDVERWIYQTYKDKHPIHIDIAMQAGRGNKLVLEHPEKAKEIHEQVDAAIYCEGYYTVCAQDFNQTNYVTDRIIDGRFNKVFFNTSERESKYLQFDKLLSGDSYTIPWCSESKQYCDFNTSTYDGE